MIREAGVFGAACLWAVFGRAAAYASIQDGDSALAEPASLSFDFPKRMMILAGGQSLELRSEKAFAGIASSDKEMTVFILDTIGDKNFKKDLDLFEKRILNPEEFPAGTSSGFRILIEADSPETFAGGLRRAQRLGKIRWLIIYSHMGPGRVKMNEDLISAPFLEHLLDPKRLADQARIVFAGCEFAKESSGLRAMEFLGYKWLRESGGSLGAFDRYSINDQDSPVGTSPEPDDRSRLHPKADQTGAAVHDDFQRHFIRFSLSRSGRQGVFELGGEERVVLPAERKKCAEGRPFDAWISCIELLEAKPKNLDPATAF